MNIPFKKIPNNPYINDVIPFMEKAVIVINTSEIKTAFPKSMWKYLFNIFPVISVPPVEALHLNTIDKPKALMADIIINCVNRSFIKGSFMGKKCSNK